MIAAAARTITYAAVPSPTTLRATAASESVYGPAVIAQVSERGAILSSTVPPAEPESAQDVANVCSLLAGSAVRLLFVLARQHLADEPEREKLHTDDHEQYAEQEHWAPA